MAVAARSATAKPAMRDPRRTHAARPRASSRRRSRTAWELAGVIAGLLLALLSAPYFWT